MDTRGGSDNENDQLPRTTLAVVIEHTSTCNSNMKYVSLAINYISIGNVWKCCPVLWRRNYIPTHFSRSWCWSSLWSCCNNHFKSITKEQRLLQKECSITHGSNILRSIVPAISIHQNQCWQLWPIISSNATFQIRNFLLTTSVEKKHLLINLDSKLVLLSVLWWVIFNPCCPNTFSVSASSCVQSCVMLFTMTQRWIIFCFLQLSTLLQIFMFPMEKLLKNDKHFWFIAL